MPVGKSLIGRGVRPRQARNSSVERWTNRDDADRKKRRQRVYLDHSRFSYGMPSPFNSSFAAVFGSIDEEEGQAGRERTGLSSSAHRDGSDTSDW